MGLDMFAFAVSDELPLGDIPSNEEWNKLFESKLYKKPEEFYYWRKHPDLHGWMENLYRMRGGIEDFNCIPIRLYPENLDELETAIKERNLPHTEGFFFGQSQPEDLKYDLEFIKKAREKIEEGYAVFYDSWW